METNESLMLFSRTADSQYQGQTGVVSSKNLPAGDSFEHKIAFQKAKADLKQVVLELENELSLKFQIEASLHHEREQLFSSKHVKVMELRDLEIRELAEQREEIASWLRRCVAEAERAAKDVSQLKASLDDSKAQEQSISMALDDLSIAEKVLTDEFEEAAGKAERLLQEQRDLRESLKEQDTLLMNCHSAIEHSAKVASTHTADRVSLKSNARRMEVIEAAVSCIAASVRRADHTLTKIQNAVYTGHADQIDPADDDGFDSEADAAPTSFPPKVAQTVLPLLVRIGEIAHVIEESIQTFTANQSRRERERMEEHIQHLASIRASNAKALELCNENFSADREVIREMECEREDLLSFLMGQQRETVSALEAFGGETKKRSSKRETDQNSSFFKDFDTGAEIFNLGSDSCTHPGKSLKNSVFTNPCTNMQRLSSLEQIYELSRAASNEAASLQKNNEKWREKVKSQEGDYTSVRKLRHSYRDLESKKIMLSIDIRDAEQRNKELKMSILDYSDELLA